MPHVFCAEALAERKVLQAAGQELPESPDEPGQLAVLVRQAEPVVRMVLVQPGPQAVVQEPPVPVLQLEQQGLVLKQQPAEPLKLPQEQAERQELPAELAGVRQGSSVA